MTIITAVPPPEAPGKAVSVPTGTGHSAIPGPLRFLGRALRTLWSNGKARVGLIILGLIIAIAIFAPVIAPHSPTATTFPPIGALTRSTCSAPPATGRTSSRK